MLRGREGLGGGGAEGIITACHLTFAVPKGQMSDQNLVWSDILANEIIRTRLNVWHFLDWSDIMSDHFSKVIIPTGVRGGEGWVVVYNKVRGREGEVFIGVVW